MKFGIMFFSSQPYDGNKNKYHVVIEAAQFADTHDFCCVWIPERHFDSFGGIFPNPSVMSSALAMITQRIQLRAGSLVSPLHDVLRIAEEWAVVDNLSNGRAAISFGSGWNVNDFVFYPDRYNDRRDLMFQQIDTVQRLWQGESCLRPNTFGKEVELSVYPKPVQKDLPIWVTSSGNPATFTQAGSIGANLLTHMIGQDIKALAKNIRFYRASLMENGFEAADRKVSLMLHTFIGKDRDAVKNKVQAPFKEYLRSAVRLENKAAKGGGAISGGHQVPYEETSGTTMEELLNITFEKYYTNAALLGTVETCKPLVQQLEGIGVDEIACLVDFGVDDDEVLAHLEYLNDLRMACAD
ncbi:siderophore biosynthesis protein [Ktedonobacter sp. SOSP1-52]|uniref:MupA/Atu3671 family FMN-dependent luciferase-like monooxygenase n=1 Tax=Ktedonobacter sp. SOSP1-52 TaxID=2778366 RepID=UPI001915027C|nr:MupA/Atu3671 family FMN-dependent luciferase-like monooxygenase [Ktedonobacter sp. SOSP1-52]GHO70183.1 siderophore biosynthesis protein [Ktedonobacter sp. SOSP1-52]